MSWRGKNERFARIQKLKLLPRRGRLGFLLRGLALGNLLAQGARVFPIEGLYQRFLERRILRVMDYHPHPGRRLQKAPVQPDGTGQRRDNGYPGEPVKHAPNLPPALALSNCPLSL